MIVSNSTPLIYLAKLNRLQLLRQLFRQVIIPVEVKTEVVDQGKMMQKADAFLIEKEINSGWIKIRRPSLHLEIPLEIHNGEKAAIVLACSLKAKIILMDETAGRTAAKLQDLQPRGTVYVLLKAVDKKLITFDEFLRLLNQLAKEGFHLSEEIYTAAIGQARMLGKGK